METHKRKQPCTEHADPQHTYPLGSKNRIYLLAVLKYANNQIRECSGPTNRNNSVLMDEQMFKFYLRTVNFKRSASKHYIHYDDVIMNDAYRMVGVER
ncbi:hypothetical protein T12_10963 [Trichinella patagoniensis]|uniref:PiggyBac transposable element-derived protein domain-containing protein n=1 Tax=Trichinella patagoniensis TaxID=990121 RepID=A0A0V1AEK9_9BILA|nr:hypothetical protein T12_10963 [Trichinella patagoniensis]